MHNLSVSGASAAAAPDSLSVVVQLLEAACRARDGDHEATKAHIADAVRILQRTNHTSTGVGPVRSMSEGPAFPTGLLAWQARRIIAHIEANLSRKIPVSELAQLLTLSPSHFGRAFRRTFGEPPRAYVLHRRIEIAKGLMLTSPEPLSSIALSCGMYDQAHFTRCFHRVVGEAPHSWRRNRLTALNSYQSGVAAG
jgi:AraC-like DNA-binding protein